MSTRTIIPKPVESYEVFHWPEFKAFLNRLGVPVDTRVTSMKIDLPGEGHYANFTVTALGVDASPDDNFPPDGFERLKRGIQVMRGAACPSEAADWAHEERRRLQAAREAVADEIVMPIVSKVLEQTDLTPGDGCVKIVWDNDRPDLTDLT